MTKSELAASVAKKTGMTIKDSEKALSAIIEVITETLSQGNRVQLVGFGTFEVRERAERTGINPQTQQKIKIAASRIPAFRAGSALKEAVSN